MAAENIFLQYLQPVRSVQDYQNDAIKQEGNQLQIAAARMQAQQAMQGQQDDQMSRQLAQSAGGNTNAMIDAYMKAGLVKQAQSLQKSMLEADKSRADVRKTQAEALDKQLGAFRSFVPQINSPEAAGQYAAAMYDHPELGKLASQFGTRDDVIRRNMDAYAKDPRGWMVNSAGVTADKLLSSMEGKRQNINAGGASIGQTTNYYGEVVPGQTTVTPITQSADNAATVGASRANNMASVAQSASNAQMTDSRARDLNATKVEENRIKAAEGKPLNDSQSKALLFGSRMREADKILGTLAGEGTEANYGQNLPMVGGIVTALSSSNQQMLKQAKTDFMTAILRRESGAAISSGEYDTADRQYFPQAGDSAQVKAQKAQNRQLAIDGVLAEVPERNRDSLQAKPKQDAGRTVTRTGMRNGKRVVQYSDGSIEDAK